MWFAEGAAPRGLAAPGLHLPTRRGARRGRARPHGRRGQEPEESLRGANSSAGAGGTSRLLPAAAEGMRPSPVRSAEL